MTPLAGQHLGRFAIDGRDVGELESLSDGQRWWIRNVENVPDTGELYVAIDAGDASIVRLIPEE